MSRMRIGPALRIEAGCYTERWLTAAGVTAQDERRRTLPSRARVRGSGMHLGGILGRATRAGSIRRR